MKTGLTRTNEAIGKSFIDAGYGETLSRLILDWFSRRAEVRRVRDARAARLRERRQTARIMSELPYDIRADVGWPARYDKQNGSD